MKILVCNVGSTSLKFKLYRMPSESLLAESKIERVGSHTDAIYYYHNLEKNIESRNENESVPSYTEGINVFLNSIIDPAAGVVSGISEIGAIGFKTVLAKNYYGIHELDEDVLHAMEEYLFVAPAHNGPYLEAIRIFKQLLPETLLVGVFETAFHTTIPLERRMYAVPYEWYEKYGIMRMGYHGASHGYIAKRITQLEGKTGRLISCHLGGSSSICAILDGKSVDTSFGFSLQTGLPHANRVGDMDPYVVPFLMNEGCSFEEILEGLSKRGGLLGVSGVSNDLRTIQQAADSGNQRAKLAIDVFICGIVRYIGAFYAELGGLDNIVFTGGIGENSAPVRRSVCEQIAHMGIVLDYNSNEKGEDEIISQSKSPVKVFVVSANEEIGIARETFALLSACSTTIHL